MSAYYNEIDPKKAAWLRELISAGLIAPGDVDERSIADVRPDDLRGSRNHMIDHKAATDPMHNRAHRKEEDVVSCGVGHLNLTDGLILNACIQAGIDKPRYLLSESVIRSIVEKFDPSRPIWPHAGTRYRKQRDECPSCHGMSKEGRGSSRGRHYWLCRLCGSRGAEKL